MNTPLSVGIGLYVASAVAWSLIVAAKTPPVKFTFTKSPEMSDAQAKSTERVGQLLLVIGVHTGIIACSLLWPVFVAMKLYNYLAKSDDED